MAIDLLALQPHKVSRDLRGYSVFFYGEPKTGKTTTAARFPESLLLAFEKGYNAIPGIIAQPINSWAEFKQTLRELKKPEVKEKFSTIIIDTADIASHSSISLSRTSSPTAKAISVNLAIAARL